MTLHEHNVRKNPRRDAAPGQSMPSRPLSPLHSTPRRRPPPAGSFVLLLAAAALLVIVLAWWLWQSATTGRILNEALTSLAGADSPAARVRILKQWEQENARVIDPHREDLIRRLMHEHALTDSGVRTLLVHLTGADYGARREDWDRWIRGRKHLDQDAPPDLSPADRISLRLKWIAPIGLTAWFTTILPLDGQIYLGTLGAQYQDPQDVSDGVVRVDGASGEAVLLFEPPDGALRDVVGIAAGNDCLFVASRNGRLYCLEPDGALRWGTSLGAPAAGAPASPDLNGDGISDAVAVSDAGLVVAINGAGGGVLWKRQLPTTSPSGIGAAIAYGPLNAQRGSDLLVSLANGQISVLAARDGRVLWKHELAAGSLSGGILGTHELGGGPPGFIADRHARVWSILHGERRLRISVGWELFTQPDQSIVASLRTIAGFDAPPAIIACGSAERRGEQAWVAALDPGDIRWRYGVPGRIWSTPVVADVNRRRGAEIIVCWQPAEETAGGRVLFLSGAGHRLHELRLPAAIVCPPVVADVDGDDELDLLLADRAGYLHCYSFGQRGPVEWGLYGGDSHNTRNAQNAERFGQAPFGRQWGWRPE